MDTSVLVAVITGSIALIGTIITVMATNRATLAALSEQSKISDEKINGEIKAIKIKIDDLSERVEKHNQIVERTYKLESRVSVLEAKKGETK